MKPKELRVIVGTRGSGVADAGGVGPVGPNSRIVGGPPQRKQCNETSIEPILKITSASECMKIYMCAEIHVDWL